MDKLQFSVSICVYGKNDPQYFRTAMESILHGTRVPDEVVLVVDGPVPPELGSVIAEYEAMPHIRVLRLEKNCGHGVARRTGLDACRYPLVALMDADDISLPDRFERQLACFAADPSLSAVGGYITEFIGDPENTVSLRVVPTDDAGVKNYLKNRCPMNQVTVMLRRADVIEAGGYLDFYCEEDYYLWARMTLRGMRFMNLPIVLVNVRGGADMYRRRGGIRYFRSEKKMQKFLLRNHLIGYPTYAYNVLRRLIVEVLLPNRVRGFVFRKFARRPASD